MDSLTRLYDLAESEHVDVELFPMHTEQSMIIRDNGQYAIALNSNFKRTEAEEACILAHELGHQQTGCVYTAACPLQTRGRCEYRADKWAVFHLMPFEKFTQAIDSGITTFYELAEHFQVTEEFVRRAVDIYTRSGLLCG